jgi:hypothetical protein
MAKAPGWGTRSGRGDRMRWFHEGVDRLHVELTRRVVPPVFRGGVISPTLHEHLAAIHLELPPLTAARRYTITARTLVGDLEAGFQVRPGPRPDLPVLVYHHGLGEMPYDKCFRGIFRARPPVAAHLVAVRAPFHRSWFELFPGLATLGNLLAMCAVAIKLIESVRLRLVEYGARGSLVTGISLGGFVTLMHHLTYGTADGYVPMLAGPDLAHIILCTHYRHYLAAQALENPAPIQALLDFRQVFQASDTHRVFPLLARYDLDMLYAHHHACYTASDVPTVTIERGHITGALAFTALRTHLLSCLRALAPTAS